MGIVFLGEDRHCVSVGWSVFSFRGIVGIGFQGYGGH